MTRKYWTRLTLVISLTAATQSAVGVTIRISQESSPNAGDFASNVLGTIEAYDTASSVAAYYNYDLGDNASWNGPAPTMVEERSHIFFVNASGGLALVFVHDKAGEPFSTVNDGMASMQFALSGDTASWMAQDDNSVDTYSNTGNATFTAQNSWNMWRTDGGAIGALNGNWCLTAKLTSINTHGSAGLVAYSGDGTTITLSPGVPQLNRRVHFQLMLPAEPVNIASANPPKDNPFIAGTQPFCDVLQTGTSNVLTQGIGAAGTPALDTVIYAFVSVTFDDIPSPPPSVSNVSVVCTGGTCPTVTAVTGFCAGPYVLSLSGSIPPGHCTTFTFAGTGVGQKLQYQYLPGDASMNGTVNTQDLLALVQGLNQGMANAPDNLARYDMNRSGIVNTQDLLRLVQLLNGTNTTQAFNGQSVAACP